MKFAPIKDQTIFRSWTRSIISPLLKKTFGMWKCSITSKPLLHPQEAKSLLRVLGVQFTIKLSELSLIMVWDSLLTSDIMSSLTFQRIHYQMVLRNLRVLKLVIMPLSTLNVMNLWLVSFSTSTVIKVVLWKLIMLNASTLNKSNIYLFWPQSLKQTLRESKLTELSKKILKPKWSRFQINQLWPNKKVLMEEILL